MVNMADPQLGYLARPADVGIPVLILHSWWGLTRSFTDYADRLAAQGFLAGCVDLYGGRLATTPEEASALRSAPRRVPMYRSMLAGIDELIVDPAASTNRVGIVGFSMGGHWAVWLAQRPEAQAGAVVIHYATRALTKGGPPIPILAHFAGTDPFVTPAGRRTMERSFARFGWPYTAMDHPRTRHWFAESAEDSYDRAAADTAFGASCRHLVNSIGGPPSTPG
jgi:carboxymethylenebutenolidase